MKKISQIINETFIVLIPKVNQPQNFNHFIPISLCNFAYKIVATILAGKLSKVLDKIISPNQSAFVKGRWIAENTAFAQEIVHKVQNHKGKKGLMIIKMDLKKAYDQLEWNFLDKTLDVWGFSKDFRWMIRSCVSLVRFSLLLNGSIYGSFHLERSLCRGDPLSPLLFILCSEIFLKCY